VHLNQLENDIVLNENQNDAIGVQLSVVDTGSGIDPEILPRMFSKFTTKSETGTGLGLYISKSIIEAHSGRIWAENNKIGVGARVSFVIPTGIKSLEPQSSR
jgi:signal transduction histidine kinase